jgi:5-methyltetrahydrofolate--homocysteine methyltransferase
MRPNASGSRSRASSGRIGVELSEELQLHPKQSTEAFVLHHPEAKYFNV